jgi:crotonobetainyl-CoA:carnitine CoA-transferase CaiB-like acyl-CoA transferase
MRDVRQTTSELPDAPLTGLRVLDLSRVLAGPYCTMILGDLGAEVVKIEEPKRGDDSRLWGPPWIGGESAYFLSVNRNKRSVTINLKQDAGRELLLQLVGVSDVLVENMRPGKMDSLGLTDEILRQANPRLIHASISAFGRTGPRRTQPGYDFVVQALGGLMSITGESDGEPMKVGVAIVDVVAGLYSAIGILAAVAARDRVGKGEHIEVSLFDADLSMLVNVVQNYLATGVEPVRFGNGHPNIVPYQTFAAADRPIAIAAGSDTQWQRLSEVLGCAELGNDPRFASNDARVQHRAELLAAISPAIASRASAELLAALVAADVPCAPVNTVPEAVADPHGQAMIATVEHARAGEVKLVRSPLRLGGRTLNPNGPPPMLGEHTDEILSEFLGATGEAIAGLRADGVI